MYILKTEASFDSAHFLAGYNGKCSNLHGHRWKIVLEVQTEELKEDVQHKGMYVDFGELKKDLRNIADSMDHALIIERNSLKETTFEALKSENFKIIELDFRPTAENMAKYFYEKIKILGYNMRAVTVYETPANSATYMEWFLIWKDLYMSKYEVVEKFVSINGEGTKAGQLAVFIRF
mgnify:FL=1